jgi:hypothetical protein
MLRQLGDILELSVRAQNLSTASSTIASYNHRTYAATIKWRLELRVRTQSLSTASSTVASYDYLKYEIHVTAFSSAFDNYSAGHKIPHFNKAQNWITLFATIRKPDDIQHTRARSYTQTHFSKIHFQSIFQTRTRLWMWPLSMTFFGKRL